MQKEKNKNEKKKISLAIKVILFTLIICFFFPLCTVSCGDTDYEISGYESTFGVEAMGEKIDGNLLCGLLILIPIILLICALKMKVLNDLTIVYIMGAVVNIIILSVYRIRLPKLAEEYMATIKFNFGYYLELIFNSILILGAILLRNYMEPNDNFETAEEKNKKGWIFLVSYCIGIIVIMGIIVLVTNNMG